MEGSSPKQSPTTVTPISRCENASDEMQNPPKRARSFVLKQMLEKLGCVKKESLVAIEKIQASKVKTEPGLKDEDDSPKGKGVLIGEELTK